MRTFRVYSIAFLLCFFTVNGVIPGQSYANPILEEELWGSIQDLALISTMPENGEENVSLSSVVKASFNRNISLLNSSLISISSEGEEDGVENLNPSIEAGKNLIINHSKFSPNTLYNVNIGTGAIAGYNSPVNFSFTTGQESTAENITVTNTQPEPGETGVTVDGNIQIDFSGSFSSVNYSEISIVDGLALTVSGLDFSTRNDNTTLIIYPPDLDPLTTYTVSIPSTAIPELDNDFSFSFTTGDAQELPQVIETIPSDNATDVSLDTDMEVSFNEPFYIYGGTSFSINGVSYSASRLSTNETDSILIIDNPTLQPSTEYTVEIPYSTVEFKNSGGFNQSYSYTFTTGSRPGINSTIPSNLATEIDTGTGSIIEFDELISLEEEASLTLIDSTGTPESYDLNLRTPFFSDGKLVDTSIESLLGGLQAGMHYVAVLDSGSVRNMNGIVNDQLTWTFQTKTYPPEVVRTYPESGELGVKTDTTFSITYNENIELTENRDISITDDQGNSISDIGAQIPSLSFKGTNISTNNDFDDIQKKLFISHGGLQVNRNYTIEIGAGTVENERGIGNESYSWSFSTYPDEPPVVSQTTPENESTGVPVDTEVSVVFNQSISAIDLSPIIFSENSETPVPNTSFSVSGNKLTISHEGLKTDTGYFVSIPANAVQNGAGIGNESIYFTFRTEEGDPLTVVEYTPQNESNGNAIDTEVSVTFNQNISGIDLSEVYIGDFSTENLFSGTSVDVSGNKITINHPDFDFDTEYIAQIPAGAVTTSEGVTNDLISWQFKTTTGSAPELTSIQPQNGATLIPVEATVSAQFDNNVFGANLSAISIEDESGNTVSGIDPQINSNELIIGHNDFEFGQTYTVTIESGALESVDGLFNSTISWSFETVPSAPEISSTSPEDGATGVATDTDLTATFDKAISELNLTNIEIRDESENILSEVTASVSGSELNISNPGLELGTTYTVSIGQGAVQNIGEISNTAYSWSFTTTLPAPELVGVIPEDGATGIAIDAEISAEFSQSIRAGDLTGISLTGPDGEPVEGVDVSLNETSLLLGHPDLQRGSSYTVDIPAGSVVNADEVGNASATWGFTTLLAAPQVVAQSPSDGAAGVAVDAEIFAEFTQPVSAGELSGVLIEDASGQQVPGVSATVDGSQLQVSHPDLDRGGSYSVTIPAGAVENGDGVSNEELIRWEFTTLLSAPELVGVIPEDGATGIAIDAEISAEFSQSIRAGDLTGISLTGPDGEPVEGVDVSLNETSLLLGHPDLQRGSSYTVDIPAGSVVNADEVGNASATWGFTTLLAAPQVVAQSPSDGAAGVAVDAEIFAEFTQPVSAGELSGVLIEDASGQQVPGVSATVDGSQLQVSHPDLDRGGSYSVTIPAGAVENGDGVSNEELIRWEFTTLLSAPELVGVIPEDGATGIAIDAEISAEFSQSIRAGDLTGISLTGPDGEPVEGVDVSLNETSLLLGHPDLQRGSSYTVDIPAGSVVNADEVGNASATWGFTTLLAAPQVVAQSPSDGAAGVAVDAEIFAEFTQPVSAGELSGVLIEDASGQQVPGVSATVDGSQLQVSHPDLDRGGSYSVTIPAGAVENGDGVSNEELIRWEFTTLLSAPELVGVIPEDGATGIAIDAEISAEFSQSIRAGDLTGISLTGPDGEPVEGVDVSLNETSLLLGHPDLQRGSSYTVDIPAGSVVNADEVGNASATWGFTTLLAAPQVVAQSPSDGAAGVAVDAEIFAEFTQPVSAGELSGVLIEDASGQQVPGVSATVDGSQLQVSHPDLDRGGSYSVTIPAGAVENGDGVSNEELIRWEFTTLLSAPEVTAVTPAENATAVSVDNDISVQFNQSINEGDLNLISITSDTGEEVSGLNVSITEAGFEIEHDNLDNLTTYTVEVPLGTVVNTDEVGNAFFQWSFTTVKEVAEEVTISVNRDFGEASNSNDYRLVALPGDINAPMEEVLEGGVGESWNAFWDNGQAENFMVEYDGSDTFTFTPGNGFWLISANNLSYDQTVSSAKLNEFNQAVIPLRDGWNIISNPLDIDVSWSEVVKANEKKALQPLWAFDEVFVDREVFSSATSGEAFYFFNEQEMEHLKIPYIEHSASEKEKTTKNNIVLTTRVDSDVTSRSELVLLEGEIDQNEMPYIYSPPSGFESASLRFINKDLENSNSRTEYLAKIYHAYSKAGQTFEMNLQAEPGNSVILSIDETGQGVQQNEIVLLNTESGVAYDLSQKGSVEINPEHKSTELLLVVGTKEYLKEEHSNYLPDEIHVNRNYPNPFNPSTTLSFSIPEVKPVQINVYNMLGQKIATLVDNKNMAAGSHRLKFDASGYASGLLIVEYRIGTESYTQKILLIK